MKSTYNDDLLPLSLLCIALQANESFLCTGGVSYVLGEGGSMEEVGSEMATSKPQVQYSKLPEYLFFIWRLDLMILMWSNTLQEPIEGVGPEIRDFDSKKSNKYMYVLRHINNRYINSYILFSLSRVGTVTGWSTMYADGPQSMVLQKADVM